MGASTRKPQWTHEWEPESLIRRYHICPRHDVLPHSWVNCDCNPTYEAVIQWGSGWLAFVVTHNAFDGRE